MTEQQEAAMRQALEALEKAKQHIWLGDEMGIKAHTQAQQTINRINNVLANEALDKKAENAREIGLDYEPHGWYIDGYGAVLGSLEPKSVRPGEWRPLYTRPQAREPLRIGEEAAAFKAWFDAWWVGDGDICKAVTNEIEQSRSYKSKYTLAFGAWMAAKEAAHGITGEKK